MNDLCDRGLFPASESYEQFVDFDADVAVADDGSHGEIDEQILSAYLMNEVEDEGNVCDLTDKADQPPVCPSKQEVEIAISTIQQFALFSNSAENAILQSSMKAGRKFYMMLRESQEETKSDY